MCGGLSGLVIRRLPRKFDLQLLSQCGSTYDCLSGLVPEIHLLGLATNKNNTTICTLSLLHLFSAFGIDLLWLSFCLHWFVPFFSYSTHLTEQGLSCHKVLISVGIYLWSLCKPSCTSTSLFKFPLSLPLLFDFVVNFLHDHCLYWSFSSGILT